MSEGFFNRFPEIAHDLCEELKIAVRDTADEMQSDMQNMAPVDTGFLRDSIYVSTFEHSDYGAGGFGDLHHVLLPEVEPPSDDLTAFVAVGAEYGEFLELGTGFIEPQPFFNPAVDWARDEFEYNLSKAVDALEKIYGQ